MDAKITNKDVGAMIVKVMRQAQEKNIINTDQQIEILKLFIEEIAW